LIGKCSAVIFGKASAPVPNEGYWFCSLDTPAKTPATRNADGSKESSIATFIFHGCQRFDVSRIFVGPVVGNYPENMIFAGFVLLIVLRRAGWYRLTLICAGGIRQGCGLLSHHEGSAEETNKDQNKPTPWKKQRAPETLHI